jgi:hypothetical protein
MVLENSPAYWTVVRRVCEGCDEPVLRTLGPQSRVLDVDLVAGGLYRLDSRGRAVRRSLTELQQEHMARRPVNGGGYSIHECRTDRDAYWR